jgi:hypothetical protein|tara:strand:+ start:111 stop:323 length:213 start_codon:yes stop_codon:yes gene_type:complete
MTGQHPLTFSFEVDVTTMGATTLERRLEPTTSTSTKSTAVVTPTTADTTFSKKSYAGSSLHSLTRSASKT